MQEKRFKDLIFYEIYPTSFQDSNHDGIGDLNGITERLEEIAEMGFNAIWLNPFYASPFRDGGYDVSDFFNVDEKFGNNDDFVRLCKKAHGLDIRIIVDLVAGHASIDNPDFLKSASAERNANSDLFIWNSSVWDQEPHYRLIGGCFERNACYMVNFFAHQPAFNYGFNKIEYPSWQLSYKDERTLLAREYMYRVMDHWLSLGADGFRVDMADSLVKNDEDKTATIEVWKDMFARIRKKHPSVFFVSEWSNPHRAFEAGFDADFVLDHWDNFYHRMVRSNNNTRGISLFYGGEQSEFVLRDMKERFETAEKYHKSLALISGNHDTPRIANDLDHDRLKLFYLMLFTLPGIPFVLYGDELEMKSSALSSKDGGYQRTGTRIPMIWNNEETNHGFTDPDAVPYLPFDKENTISLEDAKKDPSSLYHFIRKLIQLRKEKDDLKEESVRITEEEGVWRFERGELELIVNLSLKEIPLHDSVLISSKKRDDVLEPYSGALIQKRF